MARVFIGVGHGGSDWGAKGYLVEKEVNLKMAKACESYLSKAGVETQISRSSDIDEDLQDKINRCNTFSPDVALDIHNNAGNGDGFEVYHSIVGGVGKQLAKNIEAEVLAVDQNSRGLKIKTGKDGLDYFAFIRLTKCPAVICEGAFVDNEEDYRQIDTDKECKAFGEAYAKGILKTLGIKYTEENNPNTQEEENSNALEESAPNILEEGLYKVQVGAFKEEANAKQLVNKLHEQGYSAIITK